VVGDPVTGHLFVGREDILDQIEELWAAESTLPSVVLYGHRRMGKSSILQNLSGRLGKDVKTIYFNMQQRGIVNDTGELLRSLALTIYGSFSPAQQKAIRQPGSFASASPTIEFNLFMESLKPVRDRNRIVILIDEYELIERSMKSGKFDPELMDYFRGLVQNINLRVALCFAGLHDLEEMTHSYWHPFFAGLKKIQVSFLSPEATRLLITRPSPEFDFNYDPGVPERIVALTNGQPYLVQLIGHTLVRRFSRKQARLRRELDRRFTDQDLEEVIEDNEFYEDGGAYFDGVIDQAASGPPFQPEVLEELTAGPATAAELTVLCGVGFDVIQEALDALKRHAVVLEEGGRYRFSVELMRIWVERQRQKEEEIRE
jgi:hypothetical protein